MASRPVVIDRMGKIESNARRRNGRREIKIEVLYFNGCPNHSIAVERLREVLAEENVSAEIFEINVADDDQARAIGFLGSPTIRINGVDVEPAARTGRQPGMSCRTYVEGGRQEGIPSRSRLQVAVRRASAH